MSSVEQKPVISRVRLALIYDAGGEDNLQVAEIRRMYPLPPSNAATLYLMETEPFLCEGLERGAGRPFTEEEVRLIINYLKSSFLKKDTKTSPQ